MTGCSAHRSSDVAPDLARNGPRPTAASSNSAVCQARTKLPFFFLIAGLCGGVVASNIPYFAKFDDLRGTPIGPYFGWPTGPLANWAFIEHLAFWGGIVALVGVVCATFTPEKAPTMAEAEAEELARRLSKECLDASIMFREPKCSENKNAWLARQCRY